MKKVLLCSLFFAGVLSGFGQTKVVADKIAGIVGDKIVLRSDITIANADIVRQGGQPQDECNILDGMLTQKALVLQAEKDSIPVTDEEVEAEIDQRIRYFISQYGGKDALEQISGRSVYQLREDFRSSIKEQRLAQGMRNKIVEGIKVTPSEVKEFYDKIPKDNLYFYESELQLGQIIMYPKASRDIELLAIDELTDYKKQVEAGNKRFETLAQLYSDDPGSKDKGGVYLLNRSDKQWDPTFFAAAWRLKDGQISPVIKSKMGYHIIQMISKVGDEATIRHILRIPQITDDEIKITVGKLDTVRQLLQNGSIGFGQAVDRFSEDDASKYTAGRLMGKDGSSYLTINELDKDMVLLLKNSGIKAGEFSQPSVFTDERGKKGVRIVYLISKSEPHRENMKDDYNKIAQRALEEKRTEAMQKWFASKINTYYIMIDDEFKSCQSLAKWQKPAPTVSK